MGLFSTTPTSLCGSASHPTRAPPTPPPRPHGPLLDHAHLTVRFRVPADHAPDAAPPSQPGAPSPAVVATSDLRRVRRRRKCFPPLAANVNLLRPEATDVRRLAPVIPQKLFRELVRHVRGGQVISLVSPHVPDKRQVISLVGPVVEVQFFGVAGFAGVESSAGWSW